MFAHGNKNYKELILTSDLIDIAEFFGHIPYRNMLSYIKINVHGGTIYKELIIAY